MDASLNILDTPSRTESKPLSKDSGKTSNGNGFASILSDSGPTQNARPEDEAVQGSIDASAVPTNMADKPATGEIQNSTTPSLNIAASTTPSASSVHANSGPSAAIAAAVTLNNTAPALLSGGEPGASASNQLAKTPPLAKTAAVEIPPAQTRAPNLPLEIVSDAQNSDRTLGRLKNDASFPAKPNAVPQTADSLPTQYSTANKSQSPQTTGAGPALTDGTNSVTPEQAPSGKAVSEASPETKAVNSLVNGSADALGTKAKTPLQAATQGDTEDGPMTAQIVAAVTPSKANGSTPVSSREPNTKTVTPAASAPPQGSPTLARPIDSTSVVLPPQSAESVAAERPANAAIDGLKPQTTNTAVNTATANSISSAGTKAQGQGQNQLAQSGPGIQQTAVDLSPQSVRPDVSLDSLMPLDVDGAPEMLTSAGLQERVHNALPQTTLHLRLAPGQAPITAPNDLALHIARQVQNGTTRFEIRIDPPEMGRIEVQMDMKSRQPVQAHLFVERAETLDLLQRDARQLERALQNLGIDVDSDSLSFSLRDGDADSAGQNGNQHDTALTAYQADEQDNTADIMIPSDIPLETYGFQLAASQGVNIQV